LYLLRFLIISSCFVPVVIALKIALSSLDGAHV